MLQQDEALESEGQLNVETLSALQLRQQPFTKAPADGDLFVDQISSDLLSDINEALISGDDLLLIMGPPGSGKSTLLNQLSASSNSRITCFSVKGSGRFNANTLFAGMLDAFKCEAPDDLKLALDELIPNLQALTDRYNRLSTIVIDDADQVPESELTKLLSSLLYVNSHDEKLLRVLLAAEPEFEDKIPDVLPEGSDLPYASLTVEPFDAMRSKAYLEFRLNQAGYFEEFPFTDKELIGMHEAVGGYPADLHTAAAAELNAQHGGFEGGLPPELLADSAKGAGAGKTMKYVLGAAACLMIGAGALSFMRGDGPVQEDGRYKVVETRKIETAASTTQETSGTNSTVSLNSSTSNAEPLNDSVNVSAASDDANTNQNTEIASVSENNTEVAAAMAVEGAEPETTATSDNTPSEVVTDNGGPSVQENAEATEAITPSSDVNDTEDSIGAPAAADTDAIEDNVTNTVAEAASTAEQNNQATSDATSAQSDTDGTVNTETDSDASLPQEPEVPSAAPAGSKIESPNWILVQGENKFTVQMSASKDRESLENFLLRSNLQPPNSIFSYQRDGSVWYALVHGLFESIEDARTAVNAMPESARRDKPWVRKVGSIQAALKSEN